MLTFGDRKRISCSGCNVCVREISFTTGVRCSGCEGCPLNVTSNK